ncbi:hypothetical protein BEWA_032670 [Theileria equi strain WA]|uniref:UDP-N-acetylglucosamine transferase subunit ALG14 n=1 Tax=Theileria equi strain WA TaxID=1537102 RepID=L0AZX4_THEEQ|nr:hypothetical protein BEWA_032670 [Theileria equi strain WA]AFZ80414.1 hypothetical protein BEWA_032670 [Theileria equi strain WA]|eukprot:XP_004830080.1 hypothetical protein BEWA_032670 [Theileria equi strain WA]
MTIVIVGLFAIFVAFVCLARRNLGPRRKKGTLIKTIVVLGPGGHSREMVEILKLLDRTRHVFSFIRPSGSTSGVFEDVSAFKLYGSGGNSHPWTAVRTVPSPHLSGKFPVRGIATLVYSFLRSIFVISSLNADLVISNGPGIAVPVLLATRIVNLLLARKTKTIYIESMCRVDTLSKSGRILRPFVDKFVVLWPNLAKYKGTTYLGSMIHTPY